MTYSSDAVLPRLVDSQLSDSSLCWDVSKVRRSKGLTSNSRLRRAIFSKVSAGVGSLIRSDVVLGGKEVAKR